MTRIPACIAGAAAALILASPAAAVEALTTEELASHCNLLPSAPKSEDAVFCIRYIQGFIDGAVATDERVALNVAAEYDKLDSLTQRAARTRIGNRLKKFGPTFHAGYCLGAPVPLREVVDLVVEQLADDERVASNPLARDLVYSALREQYPCVTNDD